MKTLVALLVLLLLAFGGYYVLAGSASHTSVSSDVTVPAATDQTAAPADTSDTTEYSDQDLHFQFAYPKDLAAHVYNDDDGSRTVAFEGPSPGEGFQVTVAPYKDAAITDAQFRKDDPSGVMKEPQDIVIDGVPAKIFYGYNDQMGDTREVWFIHGGYLYEVTSYKALDSWIAAIMLTWKFL